MELGRRMGVTGCCLAAFNWLVLVNTVGKTRSLSESRRGKKQRIH